MQNQNQMHPSDIRNMILFAVLAISMWLGYESFIARPQQEALRLARLQAQQQNAASAPAEAFDSMLEQPRDAVIAAGPRLAIDTPHLKGSINLTGARLDDIALKDYTKKATGDDPVEILSPAKSAHPRYIESGWVSDTNQTDMPNSKTVWTLKEGSAGSLTDKTPVTIQTTTKSGLRIERTYTAGDKFGFEITDTVTNTGAADETIYPFALVTEHGMPEDFLNQGGIHEGPIGYIGESLEERKYKGFKKKPSESFTATSGWIGLTTKYWLNAIIPEDQTTEKKFRFISSPKVNDKAKDRFQADFTDAARTLAPGSATTYKLHVFSGAKQVDLLETYEKQWNVPHFNLAVDFGWFYVLTRPFFWCINELYKLTGNFGIAIILFTCALRVLVFPLANTSYRSFAKMRQVSPEMYDIRAQYKDNKPKLQEELVKLYQRNNVNPAAGCLPILVQIPIFFALYKVLSNTIEMRHAPFYGWIHDLSAPDPTTFINLFGLLPFEAPHFMMIGAWPILMMIGMIIQRNISPPPDDPIQARLIMIMPYFMTYVMAQFASGLVIYWTVNNLLAIIQQVIIMKSMNVPIHLFSEDKWKKRIKKQVEEGPAVFPREQMIEENIEQAVTGDTVSAAKPMSPPKPKKKKKK